MGINRSAAADFDMTDLFAYDVSRSKETTMVMELLRLTPEQRDMDEWTKLWDLRDRPTLCVVCRSCGVCQFIEDGSKIFPHTQSCGSASNYNQLPWRDLAWISEHVKRWPRN
jgi:hypothetical protein